jgi:hypothetical protein
MFGLMIKRALYTVMVVLGFGIPDSLAAEQTVIGNKTFDRQRQMWYGFYPSIKIGNHWKWNSDIENRQFIAPGAENAFVLGTHLHYEINKSWEVAAGLTYFLFNSQNPEIPTKLYMPELRPFQEVSHKKTWGRYTLTNRLMLEERQLHKTVGQTLVDGYNTIIRFRYRLGVDILLYQSKAKKHDIKLKLSDEFFVNVPNKVAKNIFDQWRGYMGINYHPPGPMSFEVGHLYWLQQRATLTQYFSRNIVRFSVFLTGSLPTKKRK